MRGKRGASSALLPSVLLKQPLIAAEKCVETQRTRGVVAERSSGRERSGCRERDSTGQGAELILHTPKGRKRRFLSVNTLWGFLFSLLPALSLLLAISPVVKRGRGFCSLPRHFSDARRAQLLRRPLQQGSLALCLLWAITCWRKECGAGQGGLRALLTAPDPGKQGGAGWFPLRNTRRWRRGDFYFYFLAAASPSLFVSPHRSGDVPRDRKGGGGVSLAVSWLLRPPAAGEAQRRRHAGNEPSGCHLLLLSSTQASQGLCGHQEVWKDHQAGLSSPCLAQHPRCTRISLVEQTAGLGRGWLQATQPSLASL